MIPKDVLWDGLRATAIFAVAVTLVMVSAFGGVNQYFFLALGFGVLYGAYCGRSLRTAAQVTRRNSQEPFRSCVKRWRISNWVSTGVLSLILFVSNLELPNLSLVVAAFVIGSIGVFELLVMWARRLIPAPIPLDDQDF